MIWTWIIAKHLDPFRLQLWQSFGSLMPVRVGSPNSVRVRALGLPMISGPGQKPGGINSATGEFRLGIVLLNIGNVVSVVSRCSLASSRLFVLLGGQFLEGAANSMARETCPFT
jgi:hypothetical protein